MIRAASFVSAVAALLLLLIGVLLPVWQLRTPQVALFPLIVLLVTAWAGLSLIGRRPRLDSVLIRLALIVGCGLYLVLLWGAV